MSHRVGYCHTRLINASPIVVVNSEIQKLCELPTQMVFGANMVLGQTQCVNCFPTYIQRVFIVWVKAMQFLPRIRMQCVNLTRCKFAAISSRIRIALCVSRPLEGLCARKERGRKVFLHSSFIYTEKLACFMSFYHLCTCVIQTVAELDGR